MLKLDKLKHIEIVELDGIDTNDYPDFCDAFAVEVMLHFNDGTSRLATDEELDKINDDGELIHQAVYDKLF